MCEGFKPDILKIYFGEPIVVNEFITIHQPTIGEILEYGELDFWSLANQLCCNPTSMRVPLWHMGIDWNKIDDFELFSSLITSLSVEKTSIIFGDLDWTKFRYITVKDNENNDVIVLIYVPNPQIIIDKMTYEKIVSYLRIIFNIFPKTEKAKGKMAKEWIIESEEKKIEIENEKRKNDKWQPSLLLPLISSALNHPGFKYKKNELREIGLFEFMDSIKRLQIIENTTALMNGVYSGMLDTSEMKLDKELNWTRDLYES